MVPASGCDLDAARRLRNAKIPFAKVVLVDIDSILYLDPLQRPMTAWLHGASVRTESGFCAVRGVLFHDEYDIED